MLLVSLKKENTRGIVHNQTKVQLGVNSQSEVLFTANSQLKVDVIRVCRVIIREHVYQQQV